ncbi:hypothetical protein PUNSTDRAFT_55986, partial [Punctularia strigosozonata HHB-11173 SS5]
MTTEQVLIVMCTINIQHRERQHTNSHHLCAVSASAATAAESLASPELPLSKLYYVVGSLQALHAQM